MIPNLWLRLLIFLALCVAFTVVTPPALATAAYDGQSRVSVSRDKCAARGFGGAEMQSENGNCCESVGSNPLLTAFSKFLAAETTAQTATQLEFNFAQDFGQNSGLVIGRGADLSAPGALGTGEYKLGWFSVQSTSGMDAEWAVNQAKLQNVMNLNLPIRDASSLLDTGGFYLNNERSMLQSAGWNYQGGYWVPPTH